MKRASEMSTGCALRRTLPRTFSRTLPRMLRCTLRRTLSCTFTHSAAHSPARSPANSHIQPHVPPHTPPHALPHTQPHAPPQAPPAHSHIQPHAPPHTQPHAPPHIHTFSRTLPAHSPAHSAARGLQRPLQSPAGATSPRAHTAKPLCGGAGLNPTLQPAVYTDRTEPRCGLDAAEPSGAEDPAGQRGQRADLNSFSLSGLYALMSSHACQRRGHEARGSGPTPPAAAGVRTNALAAIGSAQPGRGRRRLETRAPAGGTAMGAPRPRLRAQAAYE